MISISTNSLIVEKLITKVDGVAMEADYGKRVSKKSFQVAMNLLKVQKQGRDENMQEDYLRCI